MPRLDVPQEWQQHIVSSGSPQAWQASIVNTPLGEMLAVFGLTGLSLLDFLDSKHLAQALLQLKKWNTQNIVWHTSEHSTLLQQELNRYFAGELQQFTLPLSPVGTPFQLAVWRVLCGIPYGTSYSYQQQATVLGNPKAVRAVAAANGKNKISIIIPCHRVIGSDGRLVGYAGGVERKQALLQLERTHSQCADGIKTVFHGK